MGKLFSKKMLQRLRLPRNKRIPKNWHIFMLSTVRTLIFHIIPSETCSLTYLKNCQKYEKLLYILRLLLQEVFFCRKTKTTQKNACSTSETKQSCIITYVLTNLKTCNSINPWFVEFLRLALSIQKNLIAYYTI